MLQVGWAMQDITPCDQVMQSGYAARTHKSDGVHDPLFAKVCYISDGLLETALVSCDLICLSHEQQREIRRRAMERCGFDNMVIGTTHTHSGPGTCSQLEWEPGILDPVWIEDMLGKVVESIAQAKSSAQPGEFFAGFAVVPEVAKNRREGETAADHSLNVLWAKDRAGCVTGLIVNYACHATVLDSSNYLISADYPQYIYEGIQRDFPGAASMFFNGACGDVNIGYSADESALGFDMGEIRSYQNAERIAELILQGVRRAMASNVSLNPKLAFRSIPLLLPLRANLPGEDSVIHEMNALEQGGLQDFGSKTRYTYLTCLLANIKAYSTCFRDHIDGESVILCLGETLIVTVPGELFCEVGMAIKDIFSRVGYIPMLFGYANGYFGYMPTKRAFAVGGYECETSVHGPDTEQYILDKMTEAAICLKAKQ